MLPSVPPAKQFCSAASIVTAATPTSNTNEHKSSPELRLYNYEKKKKKKNGTSVEDFMANSHGRWTLDKEVGV